MTTFNMRPVKVFRSSDEGAPQLTQVAGSFKTLLKACLVTGYGSKTSLGWEMPFEDTNRAAFRSKDPSSNRYFLRLDNTSGDERFTGAMQMTGLDAVTNPFSISKSGYSLIRYYAISDSTNLPIWTLVGHEKAFALFIRFAKVTTIGTAFFFGDVPRLLPNDRTNTAMAKIGLGYGAYAASWNAQEMHVFAKPTNWDGTDGAYSETHNMLFPVQSVIGIAAPLPDSGAVVLKSPVFLGASTSGYNRQYAYPVRSFLPGWIGTNYFFPPNEHQQSTLQGYEDYIQVALGHYYRGVTFLINVKEWEV